MQCNNCGNPNNEEAKFCKYCGQNMEDQAIGKKKGNKKTIIVLIAVALIAFIVGGYFVIKPRISNNSNQTDNGYEETMDRGNKYLESMDYEKAELEYLDAINIEPKKEEAYVELAEMYVVWGKPEEAKKIIAEGIANVPTEKQQKLPEKEEETAEYRGYTWVTEPTIEADDIYYVRSVLDGSSYYNLSNIQKESAYAVIKKGDTLGLIGMNGELKAALEYDNITGNNIYLLSRKEAKYEEEFQMDWSLYGLVGDEVIPIMYGGDAPEWYYYYDNELHSYYEVLLGTEINETEAAIPVQKADQLLTEYTELAGLYGIFSQGKLTVDFIYEECGSYSQGLLAAKRNGKWGYVNNEGNEVIPFEYDASWKQYEDTNTGEEQDYCYAASGEFVVLCKDRVWELRNTQGKVVLPAGYFEEMRPVYEDKCWVKKDGKWGVIQIEGAEALTRQETITDSEAESENLIDTLDDSEYEKLSIFFSNFSEVSFSDFDAEHYSNEQLIEYAIWHTYLNNFNDVTITNDIEFYNAKISAEFIEYIVSRYFDIHIQHQNCGYIDDPDKYNYGQYSYLYKDGYYYFMPADGAPFTWSEVVEFYDNGDGTFSAVTHEYSSHDITNPYKRKKHWVYDDEMFWDDDQYHYALVEPYSYGDKETYKLLRWTSDNTNF
ncbi:MAG: WG repeat-containing protein [Lachnospiraceae bacterium]